MVSLYAPITDYIENAPPEWTDIIVRHLLTHTAGFAEQLIVACDESPVLDVSTKSQFDLIAGKPLTFPPGSRGSYSDPGYFLLGMIIEKASGMTYADAMQTLVFNPCGMEHSLILDQWRIVDNRVAGYTLRGEMLLNSRRDWQHELPSFFGVMSTVEDLARFEIAYDRNRLISDSLSQLAQSPATLADGTIADVYGRPYGFGWQIDDYRGYRVSEHGGFSGTHLLRFPDQHFAVVVLTNLDQRSGSRPDLIARGIAGLADPRFLRPDMLSPAADPDTVRTARLRELLLAPDSLLTAADFTENFRRRWADMPARVRDSRASLLRSISGVTFVARDETKDDLVTRFGAPVADITYYRAATGDGDVYFTVWRDRDGVILDLQFYKP